ncbi:MAG: hypothetical protein IT378_10370 [Sandaracinaceae bacterium]|nr:hypothetical protein [Sandaracinaceae bacterium]
MSLVDLLALYGVVGAGCAVVVYRRTSGAPSRRAASAAAALVVWPLWAPIVLLPDAPKPPPPRVQSLEAELRRAVDAAAGSPFEILLSADAADRIRDEVRAATAKIAELEAVLAQPGFDLAQAEERVAALVARGNPRALRTAVLHRDNVSRIRALRDRHARALEELTELVGALRSQLVLARYAGSSPEGVGGIVTELWARVEGLGEALDASELSPAVENA